MSTPRLVITASPHLKGDDSTPRIMWNVVGSLAPIILTATWYFGVSALLVIAAATAGALGTERALGRGGTLADGSAVITGILLGLTLPAGMPLWMAVLGGAFGIGFGKLIFGGLGQNVFNPALLGRAFLQAAFPGAITTWPQVGAPWLSLGGDNFALPLMRPHAPDVVTAATPLGLWKFEQKPTGLFDLFIGNTAGSLGETAAIVILLCGAYLALRRYLNWRVPASIFATVLAFSGILHLISPSFPAPLFMLLSGGLVLGAVYMATDMVTSPVTNRGRWVFGIGVGVLVVVIRVWGGQPEGVMYAILLMNAMVPFISRATQPRVFGAVKKVADAGQEAPEPSPAAAPAVDEKAGTPSTRLLVTLGGAGAIAGLLIVLVWQATTPAIETHRAAIAQSAIAEVLRQPARWDTLYLVNGVLTKVPSGDPSRLERVYQGFDKDGKSVGVAIQAGAPGFADVITVMFAIDPGEGTLMGMKILAQKETPGLGDKIEKDAVFVKQFEGTRTPIKAVKAGSRRPPSEIDAITGATISSRTVVKAINNAAARWRPLITAYLAGTKP